MTRVKSEEAGPTIVLELCGGVYKESEGLEKFLPKAFQLILLLRTY